MKKYSENTDNNDIIHCIVDTMMSEGSDEACYYDVLSDRMAYIRKDYQDNVYCWKRRKESHLIKKISVDEFCAIYRKSGANSMSENSFFE